MSGIKQFVTALLTALLIMSPVFAGAQSVIIGEEDEESALKGVIEELHVDYLVLRLPGGESVDVEIDDMDLEEEHIDDFLKEGMQVRVIGSFNNSDLIADEIIRAPGDSDIHINPGGDEFDGDTGIELEPEDY